MEKSSTLLKMVNQSFNKKLMNEIKFTKGNMCKPEKVWEFPNEGEFYCLLFEMAKRNPPKQRYPMQIETKPIFK